MELLVTLPLSASILIAPSPLIADLLIISPDDEVMDKLPLVPDGWLELAIARIFPLLIMLPSELILMLLAIMAD